MTKTEVELKCKEYNRQLDNYMSQISKLKLPEDCDEVNIQDLLKIREQFSALTSSKNRKLIDQAWQIVTDCYGIYLENEVRNNDTST